MPGIAPQIPREYLSYRELVDFARSLPDDVLFPQAPVTALLE
jgi:hypothetical protein